MGVRRGLAGWLALALVVHAADADLPPGLVAEAGAALRAAAALLVPAPAGKR